MRDLLDDIKHKYSFYTVVGFLFSLGYLAADVVLVVLSPDSIMVRTRDYISGIFWAMIFFGIPVMIFIAGFGYVYCVASNLKGKLLAIVTFLIPWTFVLLTIYFWPDVFR